jgi:hypothetical protein
LRVQEDRSKENKMNRRIVIVAVLGALSLAGCSLFFIPPPASKPQVSIVEGGYVVVSPEPLVFKADGKAEDIVWSLPRTSNFRFPPDGIVIEGLVIEVREPATVQTRQAALKRLDIVPQTDIVCPKQDGGLTFTCRNNKKTTGTFKYTIRVNDGSKELPARDPMIANEP